MPDSRPRRTFAVISHPDAGKSTLTEALALHARVITEAGATVEIMCYTSDDYTDDYDSVEVQAGF